MWRRKRVAPQPGAAGAALPALANWRAEAGLGQGADRRKDLRRLTTTLFQHRWCYRPMQLAPNPNPNPNPSPSPNPNQVLPAEGDGP